MQETKLNDKKYAFEKNYLKSVFFLRKNIVEALHF